jgi:hypothetical protein
VEEQILQIGEQMMSKDKEILEREIVLHEHRENLSTLRWWIVLHLVFSSILGGSVWRHL